VADGPELTHPAYMVFPQDLSGDATGLATRGLRELATLERSAGNAAEVHAAQ